MAKSTPSKPTSKTQKPAPLEGNRIWRDRSRVRKTAPMLREKTAWEKLPSWGQHAICIGFLVIVAVSFFSATTFGGRTLAGGDTVQWRGAAEAMLQYEESTGVDALWAPSLFGGMPGYMIHYRAQVPQLDSVLNGLRRMGLWPVAHFLVLLLGTYFLVGFLSRSKLAGTLSAVAFGLTTYVPLILTAGHNTKFIALAYAPWLLFAFAAVLYRPDDSSWIRHLFLAALFAIIAALNLRAGHIQITYYVVFAIGVWWIAEGIAAVRLKRTRQFALGTGVLLLGSLLALAMVAQPYLAQWEYKAFTIRSAGPSGGLAWSYAMAWSQGIKELVTLGIAEAYGGGGQTYWGAKPFTAGPHYVGALVLMLAFLGVFGIARRATTGLGIAALLMTGFALGENLSLLNRPAFELVPLFSSFRVPETWLAAVALMLAVLAGYGAYYVQRREATAEAEARKTRWIYTGLGLGAVLLVGLWLGGGSLFEFVREGEAQQVEQAVAQQMGVGRSDPQVQAFTEQYLRETRDQRADMFRGDAFRSLLFLALGGVLLVLYRRRILPPWAVVAGLVILITVDLWGVDRRYYNEENPALRRRSDLAAAVQRYDFDQFIQNEVEVAGGPGHFRVLPLALNPMNDARSSFFYESLGGYHGAKLGLYQDYIDRLLFAPENQLSSNALDLMATRYVIAGQPLPGFEPVYQDDDTGLLVLEKPDVLPRAYLVDSVAVVPDEEEHLARLLDPAINLRHTALLYEAPPEGYRPTRSDSTTTARVDLQRYTPREIVWEVETDQPRLLVASEVYYPAGWVAEINDTPAPIQRVNHLLRGVYIPAGEHIVTMRFDPSSHRTGLLIAWLATALVYLGAIALGGLLWYRRGHQK
ncbi:MAG: hypothetical protein HKN04_01475 [Rhodothermaceae bacterium]|nr:hypothetical protein [Rhodothermaceae bacterium]